MRSTVFVMFSIVVHAACAVALVMVPTHALRDDAGDKVEIRIGETAPNAGVEQAPVKKEEQLPKETVEKTEPAKPVAEVKKSAPKIAKAEKPAVKTAKAPVKQQVAKKVPGTLPAKQNVPEQLDPAIDDQDMAVDQAAKSSDEKAAATEQDKTASNNDEDQSTAQAQDSAKDTQDKLIPVKETAPDGVEPETEDTTGGDDTTEANATDAKAEDPAPVTVKSEPEATGLLSKGGATKQGAISYLSLRQMPGNQPPAYPLQARLQKRQGSLELLYQVTKNGEVANIQVAKSSGYKDLDNAAIEAIAKYKFVPGQEGWARHPVSFELKGPESTLPSTLRGGTQSQAKADDED